MNNTLFCDKVFKVERFEIGYILNLAFGETLGGDLDHAFSRKMEGIVEAGIDMGAKDGTSLGGTVADEGYLSPIQLLVETTCLDDIGRGVAKNLPVGVHHHGVALHAAGVDHGANEALVFGMLLVVECGHGEQCGH